MSDNRNEPITLQELEYIIFSSSVAVQFQQILSARNNSVIGYEGLIRGISANGCTVAPLALFDAALHHGLVLELDRLCREKVLSSFREIIGLQKNSLLFLNLETSFLSAQVVGSGYFLDQIMRYGIPPANVVIEFVESRTSDIDALLDFVSAYRTCGVNIALDDVGTGYSNFDRISLLRPNIIKVDRSIISGITADYFKQEIFRSLATLSKGIGSLVLAEGVESKEEVLCCMEYGADLLQGYYFSRPCEFSRLAQNEAEGKLADVASAYRFKRISTIKDRRLRNNLYLKTVRGIVRRLSKGMPETFDDILKDAVTSTDLIDALYIIDEDGNQQTDTIMKGNGIRKINPIFQAANRHENLSHKDYYYQLINTDLKKYTTDRYISFATGNLCITLSHLFRGGDGLRYILCTDFLK